MEENQKRTFAQVLWRLSASPTLARARFSTAFWGSQSLVCLLNRRPPAGASGHSDNGNIPDYFVDTPGLTNARGQTRQVNQRGG